MRGVSGDAWSLCLGLASRGQFHLSVSAGYFRRLVFAEWSRDAGDICAIAVLGLARAALGADRALDVVDGIEALTLEGFEVAAPIPRA